MGFDGDDAKIFEGGEDEAFCGIEGFCDFFCVVWVEGDGGAGEVDEALVLATVSEYFEFNAEFVSGGDGEVDAFVGNLAGVGHVEIGAGFAGGEALGVDGWVENYRIAVVVFFDALADFGGIGDEEIDVLGGAIVGSF